MILKEELKKIIKGEVYTDEATLKKFSHDASFFEIKPSVVAAPKSSEDLGALVRFAFENENISLSPYSGGTGMDGGALTESIVVDFTKHLGNIGEVNENTATVQPGAYYRDFEKETLKFNKIMPSYPASREICTVGGMVANNSGGEKTLVYGKTEDYIERLKVVLADGNEYVVRPLNRDELEEKKQQTNFEGALYRQIHSLIEENYDAIKAAKPNVTKNSAGYYLWNVWDRETGIFDMTKLFVGSQGTLGFISEITFRLIEPDKHSQMLIMFIDDMSNVGDIVNAVLGHKPATFESYDDKTLKLAVRFGWEFVKRLGLRNIFTLAINGIPEAWSILTKGFPKLVLQITFDGDDKEDLRERAKKCREDMKKYNPRYMEVIRSKHEADEYWLVRRESFNLLRHKVKGKKTAPFIDDVVVNTEHLAEFLPKINAILDEYKEYMIHNVAGHIGNGNFHIIPLMDFTNEKARAIIPEVAERVYDLVIEHKGSITGEHNDGIMRTPFLEQMYGGEVYKLFEETKKIFDPKNVFNPGKKVGGSMDAVVKYMKKGNY